MAFFVENPILSSPFEEPKKYYVLQGGVTVLKEGRRPSKLAQNYVSGLGSSQEVEISLVNVLRERVARWRKLGYPGVTPTTRGLLEWWTRPDRTKKLFFCQLEAAETIIYLHEAPKSERQDFIIPKKFDYPRFALKLATGAGKTIVLGMLAAWSVLNKVRDKRSERSDTVLACCHNLTIKGRLQVLLPSNPENVYQDFDLLPLGWFEDLCKGRFMVANWHMFLPPSDEYKVKQMGEERPDAFCRRALRELGLKKNILVLNDEGHHAYPTNHELSEDELKKLRKQEEKEFEEASPAKGAVREELVWIEGLNKINEARGISLCLDTTATPYYLKSSGFPEGQPFEWIVSDFCLFDAIESGIVKIPRMPAEDDSGSKYARYYKFWDSIKSKLPKRAAISSGDKVLPEIDGALQMLATEWRKDFNDWRKRGLKIPPVMIVVCRDTKMASQIADYLSSGEVAPEFKNPPEDGGLRYTVRIDSKILDDVDETEKQNAGLEETREIVLTTGREGKKGEQLRCIIAVGMLSEGWDAPNVTQILGVRPFRSPLLCEQVVGRGLRRFRSKNTVVDYSIPEFVDIYGVPFDGLPVVKKAERAPISNPPIWIKALDEKKQYEIKFPNVEQYHHEVTESVEIDLSTVKPLVISPEKEPSLVRTDWNRVTQNRQDFYARVRIQRVIYDVAKELLGDITRSNQNLKKQPWLFPQLVEKVREFVETKVELQGKLPLEEIALQKYRAILRQKLFEAMLNTFPDKKTKVKKRILPVLNRYKQESSTGEIEYSTTKRTRNPIHCHLNLIDLDSEGWEGSAAFQFDTHDNVEAFFKNRGIFRVPYFLNGRGHDYLPDFIARIRKKNGEKVMLILEIKGNEYDEEREEAKTTYVKQWVEAINNLGTYGVWTYAKAERPSKVREILDQLINS